MENLKPNQRTITRFLSELKRDWDASETLEVRCIG